MIALLAILAHIAVPTLYDLASPTTRGLIQATICAGGEAKEIFLDQNGKPVKQAPADHHECKSCINHCSVLVIAAVATIAPQLAALVTLPSAPGLVSALFHAAAHPRGPPA
ncbi:MAG TPA: DUF2946 family protein [Parvibaculum sp.]